MPSAQTSDWLPIRTVAHRQMSGPHPVRVRLQAAGTVTVLLRWSHR
jgi:hypothetical protein